MCVFILFISHSDRLFCNAANVKGSALPGYSGPSQSKLKDVSV